MTFNKKEAADKFDNFLMIMDDQLAHLKEEAEKHNIILDGSLSDIEKLEELFDVMSEGCNTDEKNGLIVYFARHLGEIVKSNYGGKWVIQLNDEKNINFNEPVIVDHCPIEGLEFAPISTMRAYSLRKKKGTLRRAIEADINPHIIDLNHLIEE
ncbi:MAG TPA: hypothetical protein VN030_13855 [Cellvibrio sp.]|nr:hypothetical protein [Cellvibrio sp.]